MIMRSINAFRKDEAGAAVVELALISPFIAGLALVSVSVWESGMRHQDMRGAVQVAAQYYMNGGQSDTTAASLGMASWRHRPDTSNLIVSRTARCGIVTAEPASLCPDGRPPAVYVSITAYATTEGAVLSPVQTLAEEVRVR